MSSFEEAFSANANPTSSESRYSRPMNLRFLRDTPEIFHNSPSGGKMFSHPSQSSPWPTNRASLRRAFPHHWNERLSTNFRSRRSILSLCGLLVLSCGMLSMIHLSPTQLDTVPSNQRCSSDPLDSYQASGQPGVFPNTVSSNPLSAIASICNCRSTPPHIGSANEYDGNDSLYQTILSMYCARQHLDPYQALKLLIRTISMPESIMSWTVADLQLDKPTIYLTTVTSPNSKAGQFRSQYIRRHGRAIRSWMTRKDNAEDHKEWQVLWIVVEDDTDIDRRILQTLRRSGVPHIYIAYGPTKSWGNAQKNAVLQLVHGLTRHAPHRVYGHGPVYGLDDDNKIHPDLLSTLIKVVRVGVFPVGNLAGGWEAPILDEARGVVIGSDSPWQERPFPFDYGAYTFNSSLLGTLIPGPLFWKHTAYGGEDMFLSETAGSVEGLEPLCRKSPDSECHMVWHNEELSEAEKWTDEEEMEFIDKFGSHALLSALGLDA